MSSYQAMSKAAETARENYLKYQTRVWSYFHAIIKGLESHCGVPSDHLVFLKWNERQDEDSRFSPPDESGSVYTCPGAITYDIRDNTFNMGLLIYLTPENHYPRQRVTSAIWIGELANGIPSVRIGLNSKPRSVALLTEADRNEFCERIAKDVVDLFKQPPATGIGSKPIGFDVPSMTAPNPDSASTSG